MKVGTVEKFRLPVLKPLGTGQGLALGTVAVRTRVVPHALVAAPVTHFDVTAESGRAARLNRLHHTPLCGRSRGAELSDIIFAVAAENICQLRLRPVHLGRS